MGIFPVELTSFPLSYDINSEIVLSYDVVIKDLYQGVIELTEGIDYVFRDKVIFLIDNGDIFAGKPLSSDQNLIVTYQLKDGSKVSSYSNRNPINYKKFLKILYRLNLFLSHQIFPFVDYKVHDL